MLGLGWTEMFLIGALALIVVGPKELPNMLRNIGRMVNSAKRMGNEFRTELNKSINTDEILDLKRSISDPLRELQGRKTAPMAGANKTLDQGPITGNESVYEEIETIAAGSSSSGKVKAGLKSADAGDSAGPQKNAKSKARVATKTKAKTGTGTKSTAVKGTAAKSTAAKSTAAKSTAAKSTAAKSTAAKSTASKKAAPKPTAAKTASKRTTAKAASTTKAPAKSTPAAKKTVKKATATRSRPSAATAAAKTSTAGPSAKKPATRRTPSKAKSRQPNSATDKTT